LASDFPDFVGSPKCEKNLLALSHLLRELILPPGCLIVMFLAALLLARRIPRASRALAWSALILLYGLSTSLVSPGLCEWAESEPVANDATLKSFGPQAIVVLGGGAQSQAPEYHHQAACSKSTLKRIAYATYLARLTGLPILVTGGYGSTLEQTEAWAMKVSLETTGLSPKWLEARGKNTRENARFSQEILRAEGIERVLLVTEAMHARRARQAFEKTGLSVLAAPTGFRQPGPLDRGLLRIVPTSRHFADSSDALRAKLAELWYTVSGS
jgi:uncharacterized SAM-binding protein YcdF (DUF218 family)